MVLALAVVGAVVVLLLLSKGIAASFKGGKNEDVKQKQEEK